MTVRIIVCQEQEIGLTKCAVRSVGSVRIAVFRDADGGLHALEDRCPHRGAPLSEGIVYEQFVACRDHGWSVCLLDGQVMAPDRGSVRTYPVGVEHGAVWIEVD